MEVTIPTLLLIFLFASIVLVLICVIAFAMAREFSKAEIQSLSWVEEAQQELLQRPDNGYHADDEWDEDEDDTTTYGTFYSSSEHHVFSKLPLATTNRNILADEWKRMGMKVEAKVVSKRRKLD
ncbi:hypothetical protein F4818DRAFT_438010 [Hypoxylon cercidicola]|nr:hypothetical protein F4818DRAFT_438010 [Hypoxylon cercidicola]